MTHFNKEDLRLMLQIRKFENTILELFSKGLIKGTTHTCIGQEYIPVSLKGFINENDFVISNHRGHGHFIATTGEVEGLLCEILGKKGAICGGVGGSQQLYYKNFMTTGIQGEGASIGLGVAWTYKHEKTDNITYVYVGDGTFGRGTIYESLNMASLYKLPYVMIVENNGIAMTTDISDNMAGSIEKRVRSFEVNYLKIDTYNLDEIRNILMDPIAKVRNGEGPLVIEFITSRVAAHSKGDDTRDDKVLNAVVESYWYNVCKNEDESITVIEKSVDLEMDEMIRRVLNKE